MYGTKKGELAITPPTGQKIEAEVEGGLVRVVNRIAVIETTLVMDYKLDDLQLRAGDIILIRGDAPWSRWAATMYRLSDGKEFCLMPESAVLGYRKVGMARE
jgi:hypothetical protein